MSEGTKAEGKKGWGRLANVTAPPATAIGLEEEKVSLYNEQPKTQKIQARDAGRVKKWEKMMENYDRTLSKNNRKFKSRIRKGIPPEFRGDVWYKLSGAAELRQNIGPMLYYELLASDETTEADDYIERDLARTFPEHYFFQSEQGHGQIGLRNVLKVYSLYDREVGYCQGMGYIAGILLLHMPPENAFWMLVSLMETYKMRDYFIPGMPGVYKTMYQANRILKTKYSKVWNSLQQKNLKTFMFCTQWFLTIFSCTFPLHLTARIWDVFFNEGPKILYRIFLGMMNLMQAEVIKLSFEQVIARIREFTDQVDADKLITVAFRLLLKRKWLDKFAKEYEDNPLEEFSM